MRNYEGFLSAERRSRAHELRVRASSAPPGAGKGTQARRLAARVECAADRHRRHAARGGGGGHAARPRGQALHGLGRAGPRRRDDRARRRAPGPARRGRGLRARRVPAHGRPGRGARRAARRPTARTLDRVVFFDVSRDGAAAPADRAPGLPQCGTALPRRSRPPRRRRAGATSAAASSTSARTTRRPRCARRLDVYADARPRRCSTTTGSAACWRRSPARAPVDDDPRRPIRKAVKEPCAVIVLKSAREIGHMRTAGRILADVMDRLRGAGEARACPPWRSTRTWRRFIATARRQPAFKGYRGFPATVCISINEEVVHGIPVGAAPAQGGRHRGARPRVYRGGVLRRLRVHPAGRRRCRRGSRSCSTSPARASTGHRAVPARPPPGRRLARGPAARARAHGFGVVRAFVGHGIGRALHEEPQVPNFGDAGPRARCSRPGMVLAIEPMVTMGSLGGARAGRTGWTAVTADGSLAAHFEHTIAITETGPRGPDRQERRSAQARPEEREAMAKGRRDRGRGHGGRAAAQRDVPRRAGERPPGAGARHRARCG